MLIVGGIWKKIITIATAMREMQKLTNWNRTFSIGNIALLIRTFLIREDESRIEFIAVVVESAMRANKIFPRIK